MTGTQIIAKEGYKGALILLVATLFFIWTGIAFLTFLCVVCLFLWLFAFRNPERLPQDAADSAILAPMDGKITDVSFDKEKICISMETDWLDAGIIRAPTETSNNSFGHVGGLFLRFAPKGIKEALNAKESFASEGKHPFEIRLRPEAFSSARFYRKPRFFANERIGFMKLGRAELCFNAAGFDLKANVGDKIKAGQSLIGYFK